MDLNPMYVGPASIEKSSSTSCSEPSEEDEGGAATMLSDSIARALAIPTNRASRSLRDVEHIVVLTQENRS
jgi:phospholipase C